MEEQVVEETVMGSDEPVAEEVVEEVPAVEAE